VVRIDAIAVDARGRLVDDLKPADFELREDGAPRSLDSAQFTRLPGARRFAIFLDEYHVSKGASTDRVRESLMRFVDESLGPHDLLAVMKPLDSLFAIHFTEEREAARRAIAAFEGRKGDYEPRNTYERNYIAGTPARIESAREQVGLSAMNALAIELGNDAVGRKTLIVVTEGVGRPDRRRGQDLPTLDSVIRSANRSTVAIYPVDPREAPVDEDSMRTLAASSNGRVVAGDLDAGLHGAAADAGAYYLLTYSAPHAEDGKFHPVQLRVKRAGVQVRARNGYWAPSPYDAMRATMLAWLNEPRPKPPVEPMRHVSPLIRPWFGLARGDAGKTRVTIVWEPAVRVPGDRSRRDPSRIQVTALANDGAVVFEGPLLPTGPAAIEEQGATPSRAVFDAAPGRLRLRMSIQDVTTQQLDLDVRDLAVPDFRRAVAIGTPEILRARNAREFRLLDGSASAAVPVASREFSRTERLLIRFPAYGPADAAPALSAKLLSRMGQTMRTLAVAPASAPGGANEIDLPLAGLASGEYLIELTATSSAGEARDRINFRVTS
jgi:VWFA-related protein